MTTMEAIRNICDAKTAASRVPVLATVGEISSATGQSWNATAMEMDMLAIRGSIMTGRTINEKYAIPNNNGGTRMKEFEKAIQAFLDEKAKKDEAFAEKYRSEKKNIADCCKFIIAEVKKSCKGNEAACTDEYVYGLAMHYYDEENIKVPANAPSCRVVVPGSVELSEADKKEAREEAMRRLKEQEVQEQMRKERQRQEAAEKKAEAERKRREAAIERKKKEWENSGLLFNFDGEDQA